MTGEEELAVQIMSLHTQLDRKLNQYNTIYGRPFNYDRLPEIFSEQAVQWYTWCYAPITRDRLDNAPHMGNDLHLLNLSARFHNQLIRVRLTSVGVIEAVLAIYGDEGLLPSRNFGVTALSVIRAAIVDYRHEA